MLINVPALHDHLSRQHSADVLPLAILKGVESDTLQKLVNVVTYDPNIPIDLFH